MKRIDIIKILSAVLLISGIFYYLNQNDTFKVLNEVSLSDFGWLTLLTFTGYVTMGLQMYFMIKQQYGIKISAVDVVLLPLSMSLFAHIIPTNGGMIYSAYFLNSKYGVKASEGFSVGIVTLYISFIISGVFGVVSYFFLQNVGIEILYISIPLILSPYLVSFTNSKLQTVEFTRYKFLAKLQRFINEMVSSSTQMMKRKDILLTNIVLTFVYLLITFVSFEWLNRILDIELDLFSVLLILIITRISSLLRFLPGNIGIQELYMGTIFKVIDKSASLGVVFSLLLRLTTIVLFVPLGLVHFLANTKHIKIKEIWGRLKRKKHV